MYRNSIKTINSKLPNRLHAQKAAGKASKGPLEGRKRKGGRGKGRGGAFSSLQSFPRTLVPPLPREMQFSSKYSTYDIRLANTGPSVKIFGMMDFYNQLPSYVASFYQIYKYARINALHLHFEMVSTGEAPMIVAADILPYTQANSASVDPHFIASRPRAISRITGGSTGMSKTTLNKTWKTAQSTGQVNYSDSAWQSYSEALSVTPDPDHPFLCIAMDSVNATDTWAADTVIRVTYHMQFFEQQDPSLTETPEEYQDRMQEIRDAGKKQDLESRKHRVSTPAKTPSLDDSFRSRKHPRV